MPVTPRSLQMPFNSVNHNLVILMTDFPKIIKTSYWRPEKHVFLTATPFTRFLDTVIGGAGSQSQ